MANFGTMGTTLPHLDDRIRDYPDDDVDDACDTDPYLNADYNWTGWPADSRWRPATAIVGAVVALGAIATAVIINSGDSASTKATLGAPAPHPVTSAPATTKASVPPSASRGPSPVAGRDLHDGHHAQRRARRAARGGRAHRRAAARGGTADGRAEPAHRRSTA